MPKMVHRVKARSGPGGESSNDEADLEHKSLSAIRYDPRATVVVGTCDGLVKIGLHSKETFPHGRRSLPSGPTTPFFRMKLA